MHKYGSARRLGRLFCCLTFALLAAWPAAHAAGPATTSVDDTVYRADGSPAAGTLVIAWNAFTTSDGKAVAAGRKTVKIGAAGAVSIPLAPNFGAMPEGSYYRVTYKLDDGSTSEEFWSVPATTTTSIGAIRSKLQPAGVAVQYATRQYVDSKLAEMGAGGGGAGGGISPNPAASQTITQPAGTRFKVTGGNPAEFDAIITKAPVADVRAFGAAGDCVTNDGPAIQAAIDTGRTVYLPKTRGAAQCDYLSNQTLTFSSQEQRIYGESGGTGVSTTIKFAPNISGFRCPLNQRGGAALENLNLQGPDAWNGADISTYVVNGAAHGVWDQCVGMRLENVYVSGFNGDGVFVDGTSTTTCNGAPCADMFTFRNVWAHQNRGWGFNLDGGDSNAGSCTACKAAANQKGGVRDSSFLGNTWTGLWTDGNGFDGTPPGTAVNISTIVRASNLVTATTAAPHGLSAGSHAYVINVTDPSFISTTQGWTVLSAPTSTTFTFADPGPDASSSGGSVAAKRGWEIWRAAGLTPTPIQCDDNAWGSVFLGTYVESNQPALQIGPQCLMLWGDYLGAGVNWAKGPHLMHSANSELGSTGMSFRQHDRTTGAEEDLFLATGSQCPSTGDIFCSMDQAATSAPSGTKGALTFRKFVSGGSPWVGWRCCTVSDASGFSNYALALAYGATSESGNVRPMAWLMNGSYEGFTGAANRRVRHFQANGSAVVPAGVAIGDFYQNIGNDTEPEAYGFVYNGTGYQWIPMGLQPGCGWKCPGQIGATTPNSGKFTTLQSTVATGTPPLTVASTTPVANLTLASDAQLPTISTAGKVASSALPAHAHVAADISSGTIAPARLGSGAADATKCLKGDSTWGSCGTGGGGGAAPYAWQTVARTGSGSVSAGNTNSIKLLGLPSDPAANFTFGRITLQVVAADNTNNTVFAVLEDQGGSCAVLCSTTPQPLGPAGKLTLACSATMTAGRRHYLGMSQAATTGTISYDTSSLNFMTSAQSTNNVTGGSTIAACGTTPADSIGTGVPVILFTP